MNMPEASGRSFTQVNDSQEKDNGTATAAKPDPKSATAESARITVLKERKRTKTGCLSKPLRLNWVRFQATDDYQHVASAGLSAARNVRHARIAQSPNVNAKGTSFDSNSRIRSIPSVLLNKALLRALSKSLITMSPNTRTGTCPRLQRILHSPLASLTEIRMVIGRSLKYMD